MALLANILLSLVAIAAYGGYATYMRAHDDSADLPTLLRADISGIPVATTSTQDLLAFSTSNIPAGMSAQEYTQYLQNLNDQARAYQESHPAIAQAPAAPTSKSLTAAPRTPQPTLSAADTAPKAVPKPTAVVSNQSRTVTAAPQADNSAVASVSNQQQVTTSAPSQAPDYTYVDPQPAPAAPTPTPQPVPAPQPAALAGRYRDGTYTGTSVDVYYGYVKVQATVSGGALSNVTFLTYPNDRRQSQQINQYAMPILIQQAISVQSAEVSGVSGATDTSYGFRDSLAAALAQA